MSELNIDSTYGVIILQDLEPVYIDDSYARIFGYESAKEMTLSIGSILDLIAPKYHQAVKDNFQLITSGKHLPRGKTYQNINRYGHPITVFAIEHLIEWQGEPALQVTIIDLSVVEQAHKQLEENKRKYKSMITDSAQGIAVYKNFRPVMVNQAWVDLMKAPSIDYVLSSVQMMDFIHKDDHNALRQLYVDILNGKQLHQHRVIENICFDGKKRHFNVYYNKIEWEGEPAIQAVREDISKRIELEKELKHNSITDALTQVFNRHHLDHILRKESLRFARYDEPLSIILVDLDHFKAINDTWGHLTGDTALVKVAQALKNCIREVDIVGRWGGEEFLVICPNTSLSGAACLAEKLREIVQELSIATEPSATQSPSLEKNISITASFGVACCQKDETTNQLLKRADTALYNAKNKGRNIVIVDETK